MGVAGDRGWSGGGWQLASTLRGISDYVLRIDGSYNPPSRSSCCDQEASDVSVSALFLYSSACSLWGAGSLAVALYATKTLLINRHCLTARLD